MVPEPPLTSKTNTTPKPVTPVDPARLEYHLKRIGYDRRKTEYLVTGFKNGFRLHQTGSLSQQEPKNDVSVVELFEVAQEKISAEVSAGRMMGPFEAHPFENFHVSPIKLREKTEKGKYRLIHNLSWPYDETSVNGGISEESKTVQYSSVQNAIRLIMKYPKGSVTRKTDIKDAFKIIPVHPDEYRKLGLKLGSKYYYDVTLPMGGGSSCQIFEEFSTALEAIAKHDIEQEITHYLDDFFFVDETQGQAAQNKIAFDNLCLDIGVPQAPQKMTEPSFVTEFLSIELDSIHWKASLPLQKVKSYRSEVAIFLERNKITQKQLQSLVGKLSFASLVVPARAFLRRLIDKINTVKKPFHFIKVTKEMRCDLSMWLEFLDHYNGVTYFRALGVLPSTHLNMGADASKKGYGAVFGSSWVQERYPDHVQSMFMNRELGITTLELFPIYVLVGMFGPKVKNTYVLFHSDNEGVVEVLNKQSSPNAIIMRIVRPLVLLLIKYNIMLRSKHVPGMDNTLCDQISRFQVTDPFLANHGMKPEPEVIPAHLQSANFSFK